MRMTPPSPPQCNTTLGSHCIYGALALIAVGFTKYVFWTITSPLRDVPGTLLARFSRLWEVYAILKYDNTALNIALHEKYGKINKLPSNVKQARLSTFY